MQRCFLADHEMNRPWWFCPFCGKFLTLGLLVQTYSQMLLSLDDSQLAGLGVVQPYLRAHLKQRAQVRPEPSLARDGRGVARHIRIDFQVDQAQNC